MNFLCGKYRKMLELRINVQKKRYGLDTISYSKLNGSFTCSLVLLCISDEWLVVLIAIFSLNFRPEH